MARHESRKSRWGDVREHHLDQLRYRVHKGNKCKLGIIISDERFHEETGCVFDTH
jgi:hypothetical protein